MNISDLIKLAPLVPLVFRALEMRSRINDALRQGQSVNDVLKAEAPELIDLVHQIAVDLFPSLAAPSPSEDTVQAGAMVLYAPVMVKSVQDSLNRLQNAGLAVDGSYGPKTKAAVETFQRAHPPLDVDGWAGTQTQAAIKAALQGGK